MVKIHTVMIDQQFDANLKLFAENLGKDEEITSSVVVKDRLIIYTKKVEQVDLKSRNLLLEEIKTRENII